MVFSRFLFFNKFSHDPLIFSQATMTGTGETYELKNKYDSSSNEATSNTEAGLTG